jgi:uncharacterized protein (TIGR02646 family)
VKRIYKSPEPAALIAWKVGRDWQGNPPPWNELSKTASTAIINTASCDQAQLCCYCTGSISNGACHIEHIQPQGVAIYANLRFAWPNLLASCQGLPLPGEATKNLVKTQRHCGHSKGNWFDPALTINPTNDVTGLFRFELDGRIKPHEALGDELSGAVQTSIDKLNLDAPSLRARRAEVLGVAAADAEEMDDANWRAEYLDAGPDGSFNEFWPALNYNYEKLFNAMLA